MTGAYRSIGEVLSILSGDHPDLTISKIRFLESQGLVSPERNSSGYRRFYDSDVEQLDWVLTQQRDHFLPLKEIRRRLQAGAETSRAARGVESLPAAESGPEAPSLFPHDEPVEPEPTTQTKPTKQAEPTDRGVGPTTETSDSPAAELTESAVIETSDADVVDDEAATDEEAAATDHPRDADDHTSDETDESRDAAVDSSDMGDTPATSTSASTQSLQGSLSMSAKELAEAVGSDTEFISDLHRLGLLEALPNSNRNTAVFDDRALLTARAALALAARGLPARTLRMYRIAANREAGVYQQLLATLKARGDVSELRTQLAEIVDLGEALHRQILSQLLRPYLD